MDSQNKIFYLIRYSDIREIEAKAVKYFSTPEYTKVESEIKNPKENETEQRAKEIIREFSRLYAELVTRCFYAVEIALAISDNDFLLDTEIGTLAEFVKKNEKQIKAVLNKYQSEKGDPKQTFGAERSTIIDKIIFIHPGGYPKKKETMKMSSYIKPREGEEPLQKYPPFIVLVNDFISTASKIRYKLSAQEGKNTRDTHYAVPRNTSLLATLKSRKIIDNLQRNMEDDPEFNDIVRDTGKFSIDKIEVKTDINKINLGDLLNKKQQRILHGLYDFVSTDENIRPRYIGENDAIRYLECTTDLDTLVMHTYPAEGKNRNTKTEYKIDLCNTLAEIQNLPTLTIRHDRPGGKKELQLVKWINLIQITDYKKGTPVKITFTLYHGKEVNFYFPKGLTKIENEGEYHLAKYLYTERNATREANGVYYPRSVKYIVNRLMIEAGLDRIGNKREARKRLKNLLNRLIEGEYITGYTPENIPTGEMDVLEIKFPDDKNFNSVSKYSKAAKELKAKNE